MLIKPLGRSAVRPPVLLVPKWKEITAYTPEGILKASGYTNCYNLLKKLEKNTLYVSNSLRDLLNTTGSQYWQAELWKGHVTTMRLDGTSVKVNSLRRILDTVENDDNKFTSILELLSWLASRGVPPGSISSMAWNLWRSTLENPVSIAFDGDIGRQAFYGGRQEATPGIYKDMVALDISSAYPYEMSKRPYAGNLRPVSIRTEINPQEAGMSLAKVIIPDDLPHSPLPIRLTEDLIQWRKGEVLGSWTWLELNAAKKLGCKVTIIKNYAPLNEIDPFSQWWEVVRDGRKNLNPPAAKLVKSLSNSLWGMFGMTGDDRGLVRWTDNLGFSQESIARNPKRLPQANTAHIAAETTARVRVRMLMEGLYGAKNNAPNYPVHIDTDGVIIPIESMKNFNLDVIGEKSGQWRAKQLIKRIEVKAPQLYRFKCEKNCTQLHTWHYVASGMTEAKAGQYFEKTNKTFKMTINQAETNLELNRELAQIEAKKVNKIPD
jgi:DNA polymerase type B, organellar and viral